jgi:BASS family bile acid:Na+ symporter
MFIIGANLEIFDIRNIMEQKKQVLAVTLGQVLLLPLCALLIIVIMQPPTSVAGGMLLVSLCPGGSISNIYSLLSIILLPLLMLTVLPFILDVDLPLDNFITEQAFQLLLLLLFPVVLGMLLRYVKPHLTLSLMPFFEKIGALGLLLLLLSIFMAFHHKIHGLLFSLLLISFIFTSASILIALCISKYLNLSTKDQAAIVMEYPVRNLSLVTLIAMNIFSNSDYLLFGAVFFVTQTPLMLCIAAWYRISLSKNKA